MTDEELLSLLDDHPAATPGIPFPFGAIGDDEKLHFLWLHSSLLDSRAEHFAAQDTAIPIQRWMVRTAVFEAGGESSMEDFQAFFKRGFSASEPFIRMRVKRDNRHWSKWIRRSLGKSGERFNTVSFGQLGTAYTWQFEFECTDDCDIELAGAEAIIKRIGH